MLAGAYGSVGMFTIPFWRSMTTIAVEDLFIWRSLIGFVSNYCTQRTMSLRVSAKQSPPGHCVHDRDCFALLAMTSGLFPLHHFDILRFVAEGFEVGVAFDPLVEFVTGSEAVLQRLQRFLYLTYSRIKTCGVVQHQRIVRTQLDCPHRLGFSFIDPPAVDEKDGKMDMRPRVIGMKR